MREGLRRMHGGRAQPERAQEDFVDALRTLSLTGGDEVVPFNDHKTVNALCDAALAELGSAPSYELKNECAWLKLKSPVVHDAQMGLALARAAVAESQSKDANVVQTLSEALAQTGNAHEGLELLEKLAAEGRGSEMEGGDAFLTSERARLQKLAAEPTATPTRADAVGSP
jgi:hypothetical protein